MTLIKTVTPDQPQPAIDSNWQQTFIKLTKRLAGKKSEFSCCLDYAGGFPADYRLLMPPRYAVKDIIFLKYVFNNAKQVVDLRSPLTTTSNYRLNFYSLEQHYLDEYMPVLENLGLRVVDQVQFRLNVEGRTGYIKSFSIKAASDQAPAFYKLKKNLLGTIQAVLDGKAENDVLNALIVLTGMEWQAVDVLRAYRNYFLQLGSANTETSIHKALLNNPQAALCLFNYFEARFRPDPKWKDATIREEQALFPLRLELLEGMQTVVDVNDDRILRALFNLIDATVRSNFHSRKSRDDYFIAFKVDSLGVIDMPLPRPFKEIYVHAVHMEGIHLRGGKVSRGGIRWSDRPDDFRTEILDLMQTQISKNALIVPTGAKGGFIVKNYTEQTDLKTAAKTAYITLIDGLLDLTDNYQDNEVVRSPGMTYDDADPYLVVAADKGTAQFSDIANGVSAAYQFWLGDGFASGGSHGYNHKELGITARGAWECVKRHFRELGKDIQAEAFSVVGIGSMDGDVFGNGMLLSPFIRLRAAISGQHIFIDPNPPEDDSAFNERKRLFLTPGSSWGDYDSSLISSGGGVYPRAAKEILLSAELKNWLGLRFKSIDADTLIKLLLTAPTDLLWLGGIGTYVKASSEKHEDAGDRNNDNVRVDAKDLAAKVVGEGANLGFTQSARVEYNLKGGLINTDAVDNSAGVDTSDHEVNLKILLNRLQKQHFIDNYQTLFNSITDEVCRQVLADNYAQSLCLSLELIRSQGKTAQYLQLAERLEELDIFDRSVESFPTNKEVMARPGQCLTRPELAVLMAACKMYLTRQLQNQPEWLNQNCLTPYLENYFPAAIVEQFGAQLPGHPLANEIKATVISNKIINQAGFNFLSLLENDNVQAVSSYLTYDKTFELDLLRQEIHALDNKIDASIQYEVLDLIDSVILDFCRWQVRQNKPVQPEQATIDSYRTYIENFKTSFNPCADGGLNAVKQQFCEKGIPEQTAKKLALLNNLKDFPLFVQLAEDTALDIITASQGYNSIIDWLSLAPVLDQLSGMALHGFWEIKTATHLQFDIKQTVVNLLKAMLRQLSAVNCKVYFNQAKLKHSMQSYRSCYQEVTQTAGNNLLAYFVLAKELQKIT